MNGKKTATTPLRDGFYWVKQTLRSDWEVASLKKGVWCFTDGDSAKAVFATGSTYPIEPPKDKAPPKDYLEPSWNECDGWKSAITPEVRELWFTFTDEQRFHLAIQAEKSYEHAMDM